MALKALLFMWQFATVCLFSTTFPDCLQQFFSFSAYPCLSEVAGDLETLGLRGLEGDRSFRPLFQIGNERPPTCYYVAVLFRAR
jgi:hypothetical protein